MSTAPAAPSSDLGVELGQGYLYSRPVPAEAFRHLLQAQQIDLT